MRIRVAVLLGALLVGALVAAVPAAAENVPASDIQVLPKHYQEIAYPHALQGASPQYVMHSVYDGDLYDGRSHFTVVRRDGATVWSDVDASADAAKTSLVGRYLAENVGDSTYWPAAVRFRDVETHATVGQIAMPGNETLAAIGPGWLLTTRAGGTSTLGHFLVIRRLDGSVSELPDVPVDEIPTFSGNEGDIAWVHDDYFGPLFRIDVAAGTASVVHRPEGTDWAYVIIGPRALFNVKDNHDGHTTITRIDRSTGAATVTDLVTGLTGNAPWIFARGDGLAIFHMEDHDSGRYWAVDLRAGTLGTLLDDHVSDVLPMGNGAVALAEWASAPGAIAVDAGSGPAHLVDFPRVAEGSNSIAFDGTLRSRWGDDTTWSIDPDAASPSWSRTGQTAHQRVTTSGGVTLVNELDDNFRSTNQWHLSWPGGQRDLTGWNLALGHGGLLLVRPADASASGFQVERVRTGEVVATADDRGAYADGSWVWTWSDSSVLRGEDVDDPTAPIRTVDVGNGSTTLSLADVRGRWLMVLRGGYYTIVDALGEEPPYSLPGASDSSPGLPALGNGFVVWRRWTYDDQHHKNGSITSVAGLDASHPARELVDPSSGKPITGYVVDENGSDALAYLDRSSRPRVLRLPWLHQTPIPPDTTPPELISSDQPGDLVASGTAVLTHFGWNYSDGTAGIASYTIRQRIRSGTGAFSGWTSTSATSEASLDVLVQPGEEVCAQARATDNVGNESEWSSELCSRIDGTAPVLGPTSGSAGFTTPDDEGGVTYGFQATDDFGLDSYEVQTRSADYGGTLGSWVTARSATTQTVLPQVTAPGSEWCFRFRARDIAGNLSSWSEAHCSSLALENGLLSRSKKTRVRSSSYAGDGSITQLNAKRSFVQTRKGVSGQTVAFWAITGPTRGSVAVYVRGVKLTTISTRSSTTARRLYTIPNSRAGVIRLVRVGTRTVAVDALAIER